MALVFGGWEDGFAGEVVFDGNVDAGVFVGVAVVVEAGVGEYFAVGGENWQGVFEDVAVVDGFAGDVGVDDASHFENVVDVEPGFVDGAVVLTDDEGGVLDAGWSVVWNGDGEIDVCNAIGVNGAGIVVDCDPIGDHVVIGLGGEVGFVIFTGDAVGTDAGLEAKV